MQRFILGYELTLYQAYGWGINMKIATTFTIMQTINYLKWELHSTNPGQMTA